MKEQAKAEHQKNIVTAENKLKEAREYYDNLSAAILSFKMDLEEDSSLKRQLGDLGFFIKDYKKATPEVFIEALSDYTANFDAMKKFDMQRKNQVILQLKQAYTLYGQTKKALENAQAEIEALIRENLEEHSP